MATSHPIPAADRSTAALGLAIAAALATIALNAVAFWLSYEALHDLATDHRLTGARAWAWPATLDAFVIVGDLLILRASLLRRLDWFAMILVGTGSASSIILNVVSVGEEVDTTTKVVAAIPPLAALLAFTALMRQIYRALAAPARPEPTPRHRRLAARRTPVTPPLTAVTAPARPAAPALPPMPTAPPIAYTDPRCAVIRALYDTGVRPGTSTMRAAILAANLPSASDGMIRGTLRAEVELREPHLRLLPGEQRVLAVAAP